MPTERWVAHYQGPFARSLGFTTFGVPAGPEAGTRENPRDYRVTPGPVGTNEMASLTFRPKLLTTLSPLWVQALFQRIISLLLISPSLSPSGQWLPVPAHYVHRELIRLPGSLENGLTCPCWFPLPPRLLASERPSFVVCTF